MITIYDFHPTREELYKVQRSRGGVLSGRKEFFSIGFDQDEIRKDGVWASEGPEGAYDDPSEGFWPQRDELSAIECSGRHIAYPSENHFG